MSTSTISRVALFARLASMARSATKVQDRLQAKFNLIAYAYAS